MELFVKYEKHDYMDMYPVVEVRTFIGENPTDIECKAKEWVSYMNRNYSGGTTRFIKILNYEEAYNWCAELEEKEYNNPQEDSEEFITKIWNLFNKCYK
jgi:hypothetical protein